MDDLATFLNARVNHYNKPAFIADDPIAVPHAYSRLQDIEIAGFFAAIFAWGIRTTIINKSRELMQLMDNAPHQFVTQHQEQDLKNLLLFKHRTFNTTDLLYFVEFLRQHYLLFDSLQDAFTNGLRPADANVENALNHFHAYFFSLADYPPRTQKHIAAPWKGSSCKRINMFLRWMVRHDANGVDFGVWKKIRTDQLICPLDVHVARVARHFGLLTRPSADWLAAVELTNALKQLDPVDPVKYDFALFGLGIVERF